MFAAAFLGQSTKMHMIENISHDEVKRIIRLLPLPVAAYMSIDYIRNGKGCLELPKSLRKYKSHCEMRYSLTKFKQDPDPVTYEDLVNIIDNNPDQLLCVTIHADDYKFECDLLSRKISYRGNAPYRLLEEWYGLGIDLRKISFKPM